MLLLAAALFGFSMHSAGVLGSDGVPPSPTIVQLDARAVPTDAGLIDQGLTDQGLTDQVSTGRASTVAPAVVPVPDVRVAASRIGSMHGVALLDALASAPSPVLEHAVRDGGPVQRTVLDDPPDATTTATWWSGLSDAAQARLMTDAPQVVGNLEGVPYTTRDAANRTYLARSLRASRVDGSATASETAMLVQIRTALAVAPGDPRKELLTIDLRGSGRTSIAIGDLDTARDVTVLVPGMFYTVTGHVVSWTGGGVGLYDEQATLAPQSAAVRVQPAAVTIGTADTAGTAVVAPSTGVAVIAWMGYRTPDLSNVLSIDLAQVGAVRLERVLDGIDQARASDPAHVSVVAHSYGSTTALIALSSGRAHADSLTVIGSPGSTVDDAAQLAVPRGQVFVGEAHWDPVAGTGYFGRDPGSASFGSRVLDLAGGIDPRDGGDVFAGSFGHNDYLTPGSTSLHDIALISIGRSDLITTPGPGGSGTDTHATSPDLFLVRPQDLALQDQPVATV